MSQQRDQKINNLIVADGLEQYRKMLRKGGLRVPRCAVLGVLANVDWVTEVACLLHRILLKVASSISPKRIFLNRDQ